MNKNLGFSLIEIIIVIAIIGVIAAIVVVALNPAEIYANGRNSRRVTDTNELNKAIGQWLSREASHNPDPFSTLGLTSESVSALTPGDGSILDEGISASDLTLLVTLGYLISIPKDPDGVTEYRIGVNDTDNPSIILICSNNIETTVNYPDSSYPNNIYCRTN